MATENFRNFLNTTSPVTPLKPQTTFNPGENIYNGRAVREDETRNIFSDTAKGLGNFVGQSFKLLGGLAGLVHQQVKKRLPYLVDPVRGFRENLQEFNNAAKDIGATIQHVPEGMKAAWDTYRHPVASTQEAFQAYKTLRNANAEQVIEEFNTFYNEAVQNAPTMTEKIGGGVGLSVAGSIAKFITHGGTTMRDEPLETMINFSVMAQTLRAPKVAAALDPVNPLVNGTKFAVRQAQKIPGVERAVGKIRLNQSILSETRRWDDIYYRKRDEVLQQGYDAFSKLTKEEQAVMPMVARGLAQPTKYARPEFLDAVNSARSFAKLNENIRVGLGVFDKSVARAREWKPIRARLSDRFFGKKDLSKLTKKESTFLDSEIRQLSEAGVDPFYYAAVRKFPKDYLELYPRITPQNYKPGFGREFKGTSEWMPDEFYQDPFNVSVRSSLATISYESNVNKLNGVIQKFGKKIDLKGGKIKFYEPKQGMAVIAPDGYSRFFRAKGVDSEQLYKILGDHGIDFTKLVGKTPDEILQKLGLTEREFTAVTSKLPFYEVPQEVALAMRKSVSPNNFRKLMKNADEFTDFLSAVHMDFRGFAKSTYQGFMRTWMKMILGYHPVRWIKNNLVGNTVFAIMEGLGPRDFLFGGKLAGKLKIPEIEMSFSSELSSAMMTKMFKVDTTQSATKAAWGAFKKGFDKVPAGTAKVNTLTENFFRRASFHHESMRLANHSLKGTGIKPTFENLVEAIKNSPVIQERALNGVKFFFGDYSKRTGFSGFMRQTRVLPFYNFYAHVFKLALRYPLNYPKRAALIESVNKIIRINDENIGRTENYPSYLQAQYNLPITIGGNEMRMRIGAADPFNFVDVSQLDFSSIGEFANLAIQVSNPLFRAGLEQAGISAWRGGELSAPIEQKVSETGQSMTPRPNPLYGLAKQFPQMQEIMDLISAFEYFQKTGKFEAPVRYETGEIIENKAGEPKYTRSEWTQLLKSIGINLVPETDYQRQLRNYEKELRENKAQLRRLRTP